jgi:hypothetical protein
MTTEGKFVLTDHSEKHESFDGGKIAAAQSGAVLAAALAKGKGGGFFDTDVHQTGARIAVYYLSLKRRVLTVEASPVPTCDYDFALSPDGSKLAILNDDTVSVWCLPAQ